jgi:hypothetical protein
MTNGYLINCLDQQPTTPQGMNEVLAPILFVLGTDTSAMSRTGLFARDECLEADSFFCFTNLMSEIRDLFVKDLDSSRTGVRGRIADIMRLLQTHDAPVYDTLQAQNVRPIGWLCVASSQCGCLFVCLFDYLYVSSVCLFMCLSVYPSICLTIWMSVCLTVCLFVCLSV